MVENLTDSGQSVEIYLTKVEAEENKFSETAIETTVTAKEVTLESVTAESAATEEAEQKDFTSDDKIFSADETGTAKVEPTAEPQEKISDQVLNSLEGAENFQVVLEKLEDLSKHAENLEKLFRERISTTEFEERAQKNMHSELQKYKDDFYAQLMLPILSEVIKLRENLLKDVEKHRKEGQPFSCEEIENFANDDIALVLEDFGISVYKTESDSEFISGRHKFMGKGKVTAEKSLHGKIAESRSYGYEQNGKVISPERVVRYIYEEPKAENVAEQNTSEVN